MTEREIETMEQTSELGSSLLWSLIGTDYEGRAFGDRLTPCTPPYAGLADCFGSPAPNVFFCSNDGCDVPQTYWLNTYFADTTLGSTGTHASTIPTAARPVSYSTIAPYPAGTVSYGPQTEIDWRFDFTQPGRTAMTAAVRVDASVRLTSGETVDLSHSGQANATFDGSNADTWSISFPRLAPGNSVDVRVTNGSGQPLSGTIVAGDQVIATLSDSGVAWQGACAP